MGAPVRNSSWPLQRESTACQAASRATKGVQPWVAASRWTASARSNEAGSVRTPPPVGGQVELRHTRQALPPVLPQPLARGARQHLLLPAGEVGVQSRRRG